MTRLTIAALALMSMTLPIAAQLPVRDAPARPARGTASISGVVTTDGPAPQPLRKVRVTLNQVSRSIPGRTETTDDSGRFVFRDLPADRFNLSASRPGYLVANYGATRPERTGTPIALSEGQQLRGLTLRIARGSVIGGTVRDQTGQPIPGAQVTVLRYDYSPISGERQLGLQSAGGLATTDDRGMYRAWGLTPGEYAVRVVLPGARGPASAALEDMRRLSAADVDRVLRSARGSGAGPVAATPAASAPRPAGYAPTFFPSTTDVGSSSPVTLGPAEERDGVDVIAQMVPTARIDGRVQIQNGDLPRTLAVSLAPATVPVPISGGTPTTSPTARVNPDGSFVFTGVAPGNYVLTARSGGPVGRPGGPGPTTPVFWAMATVAVEGRDLEVAMDLQPPMKIAGRMVFEGASDPPQGLANIRVLLMPPGAGGNLNAGLSGQVNDQGRFEIASVVPGVYRPMFLNGLPASSPWVPKASTMNGRDVFDSEIHVRPNENIEWVLTYGDAPTQLSGTLQDASGRAATDYFVLAFPADRGLWKPQSARVRNVRPATDGQFSMRGLPPGDYLIAALTDLENGEWNSASFLASLIPSSIRVTLVEGQTTKQDLRLAGR